MTKFNKGDRFTLGSVTGTVDSAWAGTPFRDAIYSVQFDGNHIKATDATLRLNHVTAEWFDTVAEKIEPEPVLLNAIESLPTLAIKQKFVLRTLTGAKVRGNDSEPVLLVAFEPTPDNPAYPGRVWHRSVGSAHAGFVWVAKTDTIELVD